MKHAFAPTIGFLLMTSSCHLTTRQKVSVASVTKQVDEVRIMGNRYVRTNFIEANLRTRAGDELRQNVIEADIQRLYALGYFSAVRAEQVDERGRLMVIFRVTEKPKS